MENKYLTEREIHVCGLQRTGQHAIAVWVMGHFDKICFKNGMTSLNTPLPRSITPPFWYFDLNKDGFTWAENNDRVLKKGQDAIILGTEYNSGNIELNEDLNINRKMHAKENDVDEFSKKQHYILVLRSPWNQLASILSWKERWYLKNKERFISGWIKSAKEFTGRTNLLPEPKVCINYDKWFSDVNYRKELSNKLELDFTDRGLNVVMPIGWGNKGSSFDRMDYTNNAQDMKVLDRWKKYKNDNVQFTDVLKMNKELRELSEEIFGEFPEGI